MKESTKKKTTVRGKVIAALIATMVIVNVVSTFTIYYFMSSSLEESEASYLAEIVMNVSSTIDTVMTEYEHVSHVIAQMDDVIQLLIESDAQNKMEDNENATNVTRQLNNMVGKFGGAILNIGICDIEQDTYLMDTGAIPSPGFSFKTRPYYGAVTQRATVFTDPYQDDSSGLMVVTIASPVFNGNEVVGAVILDVTTQFITDLISDVKYGTSGSSWVVDSADNILAHGTASLIGQNYSAAGIQSAVFTAEITNPTTTMFTYNLAGTNRRAAVGAVPALGWKVITGINEIEFLEEITFLTTLLVVIQVISATIAILMCSVTISKQLKPIGELNIAMSEIVKGDMHYIINHRSDDEIGELSDNLRTTIKNLADYIDEIGRILKEFGAGNFQVEKRMTFLGDFIQIQTAMDEFIDLISETLSNLKGTVKQVSLGSHHVSEGSQNLANGSIEQSGSIYNLNESVSGITTKINETATNANSINQNALSIQNELVESNAKMKKMIDAMLDINTKSNEIKTIVKNIEDIAFQTNILALNAAVEASRAGQHGKGFAIVADEVRNLAGKISEEVQTTASLVEASVQAVDIGCGFADETAKSLESVTEDVNSFTEKLNEISNASMEQAEAIKEINNGIDQISSIMQNNTAISEESAATAEELSAQATVMNDAINQFKTRD